jgi:hypothetical protein
MLTDQITPPFDRNARGSICEVVMRRALNTIEAQSNRDEDFLTWDRQAEGDPWWAGIPPRWEGGCDIEDPMTDEYVFETVSALAYIQGQQEWYQVEAIEDAEDQGAANIEAFLNNVVVETGLSGRHMYDLLENAARHSYGVLVVEWKQEYSKEYVPVYRHKRTKQIYPPDAIEVIENPSDFRLIEEISETPVSEGITCRVPYTGDVYLDPPSAQSFKSAARIVEKFDYTAADLLAGIDAFGFDRDMVEVMISGGPTGAWQPSYASERNETEGVGEDEDVWAVLMVTGQVPVLVDAGEVVTKASDLERDYQWMLCPVKNICFKFAPAPYKKRPYAKYPFRGRAGRMIGHSVCTMIAPLQQESTSAFRFRIDFRDLYMSSPLLVPDSWYEEFQRFEAFPGANLPYPTNPPSGLGPGAIAPLPYKADGFTAAMQDGQDIRARASSLFSADARGPATTQQRTATEAGQAAAGADEKLDLLLLNFHFGVEDTAEIILSHYAQFGGNETISRIIGGKTVEISPEMLKKRYLIMATGNSMNASPVIQLQRSELLFKIAQADPILMQKFQAGDKTGMFAVMAKLYRAAGVRNPETILGKEPVAPPNADYMLEAILMMAHQAAQQGDPFATFVLQKIQELAMSQQQGMPAGPGAAQGQGGTPQLDVTAKMLQQLAPNQQQALLERSGVPPPQGGQGPMPGMPPQMMQPQMNGYGGGAPQGVYQ